MSSPKHSESDRPLRWKIKIEELKQQASDLAITVECARQQTVRQSNARIRKLEKKVQNPASGVETARRRIFLQSDKKIDALEQKARNLAPKNPRFIPLDKQPPVVDRVDAQGQIRRDPRSRLVPLVPLTSSTQDRNLIERYQPGVNNYPVKSGDFEAFRETA